MSNFLALFGGSEKDKRFTFTIEKLQALYSRLQQLNQGDLREQGDGREQIVETIRLITEAILWGEKNNSQFFEFFCEKNVLAEFVKALTDESPRSIKVQLLQTLSILVGNIKTKTSLYFIFSNNYLNDLISRKLDWKDEEVLAYYITLLKSVSIRLNTETISFFFNQNEETFPLYTEAIRFFNHRDQMIRATIRTHTLQIYKIEDKAMHQYVIKKADYYFTHLAFYTRELWMRLEKSVESQGIRTDKSEPSLSASELEAVLNEDVDIHAQKLLMEQFQKKQLEGKPLDYRSRVDKIKEVMNQIDDLHLYLYDVFTVGIQELNDVLAERLLLYAIYPVLMGSCYRIDNPTEGFTHNITSSAHENDKPNGMGRRNSQPSMYIVFKPQVAIFILQRLLRVFATIEPVINPLVSTLMNKEISAQLASFCRAAVTPSPSSYPQHANNQNATPSSTSGEYAVRPNLAGFPVSNPIRTRIFSTLIGSSKKSPTDCDILVFCYFMFSLVQLRDHIPRKLLEDNAIIPVIDSAQTKKPSNKKIDNLFGGEQCCKELIFPLTKAFHKYSRLRCLTLWVIQRTLLEIFMAQPQFSKKTLSLVIEATQIALRKAAEELLNCCRSTPEIENIIINNFEEQWESTSGPFLDMSELVGDPVPLLNGVSKESDVVSFPRTHPLDWVERTVDVHPNTAVLQQLRAFLLLRRFRNQFINISLKEGDHPIDISCLEKSMESIPIGSHPDEETSGISEGMTIELQQTNRVMCNIQSSTGPTRYLIRHDRLIILVAPDLTAAGWGRICSLIPARVCDVDLEVKDGFRPNVTITIHRKGDSPGDASPVPDRKDVHTISMYFADTKRASIAYSQITTSKQEIAEESRAQVINFITEHVGKSSSL